MSYQYSQAELDTVAAAMSADRFEIYLRATSRSKLRALQLYEKNTDLSASLYSVLQGLEVTVRNSMNSVLVTGLGANWYLNSVFKTKESISIASAREKVLDAGKVLTTGQLVSVLNFGFWVALTNAAYARSLWTPHLHKSFPHKGLSHKEAHTRLENLRRLRNRVAHHEPIFSRNLAQDLRDVIETVGWICPTTAEWMKSKETLTAKLVTVTP